MRTTLTLFAIALTAVFALTGCNTAESPNSRGATGDVRATVNVPINIGETVPGAYTPSQDIDTNQIEAVISETEAELTDLVASLDNVTDDARRAEIVAAIADARARLAEMRLQRRTAGTITYNVTIGDIHVNTSGDSAANSPGDDTSTQSIPTDATANVDVGAPDANVGASQ